MGTLEMPFVKINTEHIETYSDQLLRSISIDIELGVKRELDRLIIESTYPQADPENKAQYNPQQITTKKLIQCRDRIFEIINESLLETKKQHKIGGQNGKDN